MEYTSTREIICPACGKKRSVTDVTDDGTDFCGHARKAPETYTKDSGCTCAFGQLAKAAQAVELSKMCLNCKHFQGGKCQNEKKRTELSEMFDIIGTLNVKDPSRKCTYWEKDNEFLNRMLEIRYV